MQLFIAGRPVTSVRQFLQLSRAVIRESQALARGARLMPRPAPWDWARPRLLPLLAGPSIDDEDYPLVRATADLGCALIFGVRLGRSFAIVDSPVAARWECSAEQLLRESLSNLSSAAARLSPRLVRGGTLSGYPVRILRDRPHWASSLVLAPDELRRLFGSCDQIFAAPERATLMSFPVHAPPGIVVDVVIDFEMGAASPLMLDPFTLIDGQLTWGGSREVEDADG